MPDNDETEAHSPDLDEARRIAHREVQAVLRVSRHRRSLTPFQVADALDWSVAQVLQSEQGVRAPAREDVMTLAKHYRVGEEVRRRLMDFAEIFSSGRRTTG